jgi:hypothetical protein
MPLSEPDSRATGAEVFPSGAGARHRFASHH